MNVADILERAADLIEPEGAWQHGKGAYAINAQGRCAVPTSESACAWCGRGAILCVLGFPAMYAVEQTDFMRPFDIVDALIEDALNLDEWNEAPERTQAEVVAKLREDAAKAAKS